MSEWRHISFWVNPQPGNPTFDEYLAEQDKLRAQAGDPIGTPTITAVLGYLNDCDVFVDDVAVVKTRSENLFLEYKALAEELRSQWEANHYEQCGNVWPHPDGKSCMWPEPEVLLRAESWTRRPAQDAFRPFSGRVDASLL